MSNFRSFHVDGRISIKLEYDFAMKLAEFIFNARTGDKKILALAHALSNLDEEGNDTQSHTNRPYNNYESSYKRDYENKYENKVANAYAKEGMYSKEEPIDTLDTWETKKTPIRLKRGSQMTK